MGEATVVSLDGESAVLDVAFEGPPPPPLPVVLLMALPRPKSLFKSLQLATTLGVKEIHFFNCSRVDKSFWKSRELEPKAIEKHLILGLEQAVDTLLPTVTLHRMFSHLINDRLPEIARGRDRYLAHPTPDAVACPHSLSTPTVLAMGPERGFIEHEVRCFESAGFETIALGRRILRVEQALPVMLGKMFD